MGYRADVEHSCVHVYNRGVKKLPIWRASGDLYRLLYCLYYFNTSQSMPENWTRGVIRGGGLHTFTWPSSWSPRDPLVSLLAFSIMPNHYHLLIKAKVERGVSRFMHRVSMGYSKYINEKYAETGRLFEGTYKSRTVEDSSDLRNLFAYIMVKNPFELYPGGLSRATENFDHAFQDALANPFTSLGEYVGVRPPQLLDHQLLDELVDRGEPFDAFAHETLVHRMESLATLDF